MALANRPCRQFPCPNMAEDGRSLCAEHAKKHDKQRFAAIAHDHQKLYNSPEWFRTRQLHLRNESACRECGKRGWQDKKGWIRGLDVDHIEKHNGDRDLFFDMSNLQTLCRKCHSKKTLNGG